MGYNSENDPLLTLAVRLNCYAIVLKDTQLKVHLQQVRMKSNIFRSRVGYALIVALMCGYE